jgi:pyridoxal phosphate enzyme (YggS family)
LTVDVEHRLAEVRQRIASTGVDPGDLTIVAVAKGFGPEEVRAAVAAGLRDIGENYAQELSEKAGALAGDALGAGAGKSEVRWHFLGPVQRNKVKLIAAVVGLWEAVDRLSAGVTIVRHAPGAKALVQVNTSGEPSKAGCRPDEAPELVDRLQSAGLDVRGLMTIGPPGPPELARPGFAALRELADRLGLPERSMGMTGDLEVAVSEGATIVRVGTALFGPRPATGDLRR